MRIYAAHIVNNGLKLYACERNTAAWLHETSAAVL